MIFQAAECVARAAHVSKASWVRRLTIESVTSVQSVDCSRYPAIGNTAAPIMVATSPVVPVTTLIGVR